MDNKAFDVLNPYCENGMQLLKRISKSIFQRFSEPLTEADHDDFYSIANLTLWQAYNAYDSGMGVSFDGFLRSCLSKKFKTEITRRHRQKRVFDNYNISLDANFGEDDENSMLDWISSDFDTFEEVAKRRNKEQYTDKMQRYISKLSSRQVAILNLLMDGYKPNEVREILHISTREYADDWKFMKSYENIKILL